MNRAPRSKKFSFFIIYYLGVYCGVMYRIFFLPCFLKHNAFHIQLLLKPTNVRKSDFSVDKTSSRVLSTS